MASVFKRGGRKNRDGSYWIAYYERPGVRKVVRGCADRAATEALARKLEADAMLRRKGVIDTKADNYAAAEAKPLTEHLADLASALKAKGAAAQHAETVRQRAGHVLALCKAERISQISPSAVQQAIGTVRQAGASVWTRAKGASLQTCNHYLRAVKQFTRWLWRDGRAREDVLAHLSGFNVALDRRHDRRAFSEEELARLVEAAEKGPRVMSMSGPERAMLYRVAVGSGLRSNELRSLTLRSFALDAEPPTIAVEAGYSKRRRQDVQPIRRDLAGQLRAFLADREPGQRVFDVPHNSARMLRKDLAAARTAWIEEAQTPQERERREQSDFLAYRDSANRVADFHALRHTFISLLVQSGANVKVAQELARHSTPMLTLGRYAHLTMHDRTAALDALPAINTGEQDRKALRVTGTESVAPLAQTCGTDHV